MRIKIYCVTYDNNRLLNDWFLQSLFCSSYPAENTQVFVIDNHSNVEIKSDYRDKVSILANALRPDFSNGHLARNWNQAIINGFKDLHNPDCDLVIAVQNDTVLKKNWYSRLEECLDNGYGFITQGAGDQLQVFTPDAVRSIGLYDERFCGVGFQEADFFYRARNLYPEHSSINDEYHARVFNRLEHLYFLIEKTPSGCFRSQSGSPDGHIHTSSMSSHGLNRKLFETKWGSGFYIDRWPEEFKYSSPSIYSHILYPYFELAINEETLIKLNYLI